MKVKHPFKFPLPKVIQVNQSGWMSDEEFTRQMIAGVNPHVIKRLQVCMQITELKILWYYFSCHISQLY
jgi:hypothetical protein